LSRYLESAPPGQPQVPRTAKTAARGTMRNLAGESDRRHPLGPLMSLPRQGRRAALEGGIGPRAPGPSTARPHVWRRRPQPREASGARPSVWIFPPESGGEFSGRLRASDEQGRRVSGGGGAEREMCKFQGPAVGRSRRKPTESRGLVEPSFKTASKKSCHPERSPVKDPHFVLGQRAAARRK
jgi:hypothetical protein